MKIPVPIPPHADLLVKKGDTVDFSTPFIRSAVVEEIKISLASNLGFDPGKIFMYLQKFVGDEIKKDELLAEKKTMLSTKQYYSEYDGRIKEINHYDGSITLESRLDQVSERTCYFKGKIVEIEDQQIILEVKQGKLLPLRESVDAFGGRVYFYDVSLAASVTEENIDGSIVVSEKIPSYDLAKLDALGAAGFVTLHPVEDDTTIPVAAFKQIADYETTVKQQFSCCITGSDHITIYFYD
jgi:hypothetical protein